MAEGLVIFLADDLRFKKDVFLGMEKTYAVSFFCGYTTDTYDVLGIPVKTQTQPVEISLDTIRETQVIGTPITQSFPIYSSRKFAGKPLFVHARTSDAVPQINHQVTLRALSELRTTELSGDEVLALIHQSINRVPGDFRQDEIINTWNRVAHDFPTVVQVYHATLDVSSGFYVRAWVNDLGNKIGCGAVTFSIKRVTIGVFTMSMLNGGSYRIFNDTDPIIINFLHNRNL
jgi:tRNA pseudouridine(55) synthase